jgi:hypothetical protein
VTIEFSQNVSVFTEKTLFPVRNVTLPESKMLLNLICVSPVSKAVSHKCSREV